MERNRVSVTLAVGSAPWQKTLALRLLQAGMLRRVLGSGAYLEILEPNGDGSLEEIKRFPINRAVNRLLWGTWKRLPKKWRPPSPVMVTILLQERLCSRWIPPCSVFHGWMGQSMASLSLAKHQGASTVIEKAGRHPGDFHRAPDEECDRFHIKRSERSPLLPMALIRRMEREYELCDRIVVSSTVASTVSPNLATRRRCWWFFRGWTSNFFLRFRSPCRGRGFRVCFTGRVELAKGAGYLLQAWKRLALPNAELVLAGEIRPEMKSLLQTDADSTVRATGFLSARELLQHYRESDLFVFPSMNEGLAQVLLEAMASGLPVVASDLSGAGDCVTEGVEGFVTPVRDVERLAEAILWCYQHRDETRAMGRAARARIKSQFTLSHCNQRMIALYRSLAEASS